MGEKGGDPSESESRDTWERRAAIPVRESAASWACPPTASEALHLQVEGEEPRHGAQELPAHGGAVYLGRSGEGLSDQTGKAQLGGRGAVWCGHDVLQPVARPLESMPLMGSCYSPWRAPWNRYRLWAPAHLVEGVHEAELAELRLVEHTVHDLPLVYRELGLAVALPEVVGGAGAR